MLDLVIRNGKIIDGSGNPWFKSDLAIKDGFITEIGTINEVKTKKTIDAENLIVTPGFIDIHGHSDYLHLAYPFANNKLVQGITTDVGGNCGFSSAPLGDKWLVDWWVRDAERDENLDRVWIYDWDKAKETLKNHGIVNVDWKTVGEYLNKVEKTGTALNYCQLVGHHTLRAAVTGDVIRKPSQDELVEMASLLRDSMESGAFGFSCGFDINHEVETEEFITLCRVAAEYNGIFAAHIRSIMGQFIESVKEALIIAKESGIRTTISHLLVIGKENWGKIPTALKMIDEIRKHGHEIVTDLIPYVTGGGNYFLPDLLSYLPEWIQEEKSEKLSQMLKDKKIREKIKEEMRKGVRTKRLWPGFYPLNLPLWEDTIVVTDFKDSSIIGNSLAEISRLWGVEPYDAVLDLVSLDSNVKIIWVWASEEDTQSVVKYPWTMLGSDGGILQPWEKKRHKIGYPWEEIPNPRVYGSFPHFLSKYVRALSILTLEDAIRKITSAPAQFLRLKNRGLLKEGMFADITVFNFKELSDIPNYSAWPNLYSKGIQHVIVNGKVALENGVPVQVLSGKVLRHNNNK